MSLLPFLRWDGRTQRCYNIFDRELRSGITSMSFILLLLHASHQFLIWDKKKQKVLSWVRKSKCLSLHKETKKYYLYMRKLKSLILHEKYRQSYKKYGRLLSSQCAQFLPNIPNVCPMQCAKYLPNVPYVCQTSQISPLCF
jgi:hypothetical protein